MKTVTSTELKERLAEILFDIADHCEHYVIRHCDRSVAALIPVEDYRLYQKLEENLELLVIRHRQDDPSAKLERLLGQAAPER